MSTPPRRGTVFRTRGVGRTLHISVHSGLAAGAAILILGAVGWSFAATHLLLTQPAENAAFASHSERALRDRIAELKTELVRVTSRSAVEKETFGTRLDALLRRQAEIEDRQKELDTLGGGDKAAADSAPQRQSRIELPQDGSTHSLRQALARAETGQARQASWQKTRTASLRSSLESEKTALVSVYDRIGVAPPLKMQPIEAGLGGPFLPLPLARPGSDENADLERVAALADSVSDLRNGLDNVPVRNPAIGARVSSRFGERSDPFLHEPAFHSGEDFVMAIGAPVHATAAGKVVSAGWAGGYGMMVEIDHGNGLSTRYGHMSEIDVKVGAEVAAGSQIGRVGSTGRSTGAHLHYETRIEGRAVNPERFIHAADGLSLDS
jgi:murein DD-endopeptidase MepM/ murein hydrolase activator NlpD